MSEEKTLQEAIGYYRGWNEAAPLPPKVNEAVEIIIKHAVDIASQKLLPAPQELPFEKAGYTDLEQYVPVVDGFAWAAAHNKPLILGYTSCANCDHYGYEANWCVEYQSFVKDSKTLHRCTGFSRTVQETLGVENTEFAQLEALALAEFKNDVSILQR